MNQLIRSYERIKSSKKSIIKKVFIKICRLLGYEIIDQSNFLFQLLNKSLNEKISIKGKIYKFTFG